MCLNNRSNGTFGKRGSREFQNWHGFLNRTGITKVTTIMTMGLNLFPYPYLGKGLFSFNISSFSKGVEAEKQRYGGRVWKEGLKRVSKPACIAQ